MADEAIVHAPAATLKRLRAICLRFPEAVEAGGVGNPSFKVRDKIFAMQHGHEGGPSCWVKAAPGVQELLTATTRPGSSARRTSASTAGSASGSTAPSTGTSSPTSSRRATGMTAPKRL